MKHPDENPLLKEILADEPLSVLRQTSLAQGLDALGRARRLSRAMRLGTFALVPVLLFLTLTLPKPTHKTASQPSTPVLPPPPMDIAPAGATGGKLISDEELFALFPGRSLALVGSPGHQQLVFLDTPTGR